MVLITWHAMIFRHDSLTTMICIMVIGIYIHYKNHAVLTWTRLLFNKSCTLYTSGIYDRVILIQKNWACCQVVAFCSQISELFLFLLLDLPFPCSFFRLQWEIGRKIIFFAIKSVRNVLQRLHYNHLVSSAGLHF